MPEGMNWLMAGHALFQTPDHSSGLISRKNSPWSHHETNCHSCKFDPVTSMYYANILHIQTKERKRWSKSRVRAVTIEVCAPNYLGLGPQTLVLRTARKLLEDPKSENSKLWSTYAGSMQKQTIPGLK
eukprot:1156295-Pelagomonas_calceolata.AAC.4